MAPVRALGVSAQFAPSAATLEVPGKSVKIKACAPMRQYKDGGWFGSRQSDHSPYKLAFAL
jgi:hypothetical protein